MPATPATTTAQLDPNDPTDARIIAALAKMNVPYPGLRRNADGSLYRTPVTNTPGAF